MKTVYAVELTGVGMSSTKHYSNRLKAYKAYKREHLRQNGTDLFSPEDPKRAFSYSTLCEELRKSARYYAKQGNLETSIYAVEVD